mgnify:CR=1 FL=1
MFKPFAKPVLPVAIYLLVSFMATAQPVKEPAVTNEEWTRSFAPFRVAGNLYYVGTYDLACYLITTAKGHILINTGLASSAAQLKSNVEALGFKFSDIKILLTTQAHYDHLGAMAAIKEMTGAQLMVDEKDARVVADGGNSDYAFGGEGPTFQPVQPDRLLHNGDTVTLGEMQVLLLHHPGHTRGSCSYLVTVKDNTKSYRVLIANLPTIVTSKRFSEVTTYPEIADDYAYTLKAMRNITFDIWVASHASQFSLHTKYHPGDGYNPEIFRDREGYDAALDGLQHQYDEKIKQ